MKNVLQVLLFGLAGLISFSIYAADEEHPQVLVETAINNVLKELTDNQDIYSADPDKLYELVETKLIPHFAFDKMAKLALGKNWRKATDDQRTRFIEQFRLLLLRTYSTALSEYSGQAIQFLPFDGDVSKKKVKVQMEIVRSGGASLPMALSLFQDKTDAWKVYDVKVDGISLVTNYRTSFSNEIRQDGMDKLIERLAERNQKVNT